MDRRIRAGISELVHPAPSPVFPAPQASKSLIPGVRDGISNEVVASPVEIRVECGDLLLCVQRESASGRIELLEESG